MLKCVRIAFFFCTLLLNSSPPGWPALDSAATVSVFKSVDSRSKGTWLPSHSLKYYFLGERRTFLPLTSIPQSAHSRIGSWDLLPGTKWLLLGQPQGSFQRTAVSADTLINISQQTPSQSHQAEQLPDSRKYVWRDACCQIREGIICYIVTDI